MSRKHENQADLPSPPYSPNLNLIERLSGSFFGRQSSTRSSIGQDVNFEMPVHKFFDNIASHRKGDASRF